MTEKRKAEIYRLLLESMPIQNECKGICFYLYSITNDMGVYNSPYYWKKNFPELYAYKPKPNGKGPIKGGYWWTITDEAWNIRRDVVRRVIIDHQSKLAV